MINRVLIPIINKAAAFGPSEPLSLDSSTHVRRADQSEFYALHSRGDDVVRANFRTDTRWLVLEQPKATALEQHVRNVATISSLVFNYFGDDQPLLLGHAVVYELNADVLSVCSEIDIQQVMPGNASECCYKLNALKVDAAIAFYAVSQRVCEAHPPALFTLDRFNMAFCRQSFFDKIVDATICLESMIPFDGELSYRFCLFHSLLYSVDPGKRNETFNLLNDLYKARSGIVHGDVHATARKKSIQSIEKGWVVILDIMRKSLAHYFLFLGDQKADDWKQYLSSLALGSEPKYAG